MRWRDIEKEKPRHLQRCIVWIRDHAEESVYVYSKETATGAFFTPNGFCEATDWFPASEIHGPHAQEDALRPNWEIREACRAACTCGGDHNCDACMVWHRMFNAGAINAHSELSAAPADKLQCDVGRDG